jgi:hypothetical protein
VLSSRPVLEYQVVANLASEITNGATPNSKIDDAKVLSKE